MTDYEDRHEIIQHKKIAQGQKDLGRKCHCGLIRAHHTAVQANTCKKEQQTETVGRIMSDKEIEDSRQRKI